MALWLYLLCLRLLLVLRMDLLLLLIGVAVGFCLLAALKRDLCRGISIGIGSIIEHASACFVAATLATRPMLCVLLQGGARPLAGPMCSC